MTHVDDYLAELRFLRRSPNTINLRGYQLRAYLAHLEQRGACPLTATRDDAMAWLMRFDAPETAASNMSAARAFHRWLHESGRRPSNPLAAVPTIRRSEPNPQPIPDAEFRAALAAADPVEVRMLLLGRFAGLRAMEIAAAHTDHLGGGPSRRTLTVVGKGGRRRVIPAHPLVVEVLEDAGGWVLPGAGGGHWLPGSVTARLRRLLAPWTAHSLRHAYANEAYQLTRDIVRVQMVLGHADLKTTRRYVLPFESEDALYGMAA